MTNLVAQQTDTALRQIADESETLDQVKQREDELAQQITTLRSQGASRQIILDCLDISEDLYVKLVGREDVKSAIIKNEVDRAATSKTFDDNWDCLENLAMREVMNELRSSPDPEFALRAAAVANKAIRRRREDAKLAAQGAAGINQSTTNNIAILELPKSFMQALASETEASARRQIAIQSAAVNEPKLVEVADVSIARQALGLNNPINAKLVSGQAKELAYQPESLAPDDDSDFSFLFKD